MRARGKYIIIALLLATTVVFPACVGPSAPTPTPAVRETPPNKTAFQVAQLAIDPHEVNPGVEVVISANVTNTGDTADDYIAEVRVGDAAKAGLPAYFFSGKVALAPKETQRMSVPVSRDTPGTYKVTWGEVTGKFVVVKPTEPGSPKTITSDPTPMPNFTGVDVVTGKKISLSDYKGTVVLLNFVNYGCNPALNSKVSAQLLAIKELTTRRDDFVPVSIFCGCCPPDVLRRFAKENALTWPWILDSDNSIVGRYAKHLRKYGYPTLIFVDKDQYIREVTGYSDLTTLNANIDKTLQ